MTRAHCSKAMYLTVANHLSLQACLWECDRFCDAESGSTPGRLYHESLLCGQGQCDGKLLLAIENFLDFSNE